MDEDEDDFYGGGAGGGGGAVKEETVLHPIDTDGDKDVKMNESEGEDEDDSDDDVQFTLEKPAGIKSEAAPATKVQSRQPDRSVSIEPLKAVKGVPATTKPESLRAGSTAPPATVKGALTYNGREGSEFPEFRTDKRDINGTPSWPANNKPITELDIDADLAEQTKPWRLPGTDQTDFFNYGFDEYTWTQYCVRQQMLSSTISQQKQEDAQMKAFFGGVGGPGGVGNGSGDGMPGMPPGMSMPDPQQLMEMVNQGVIPQEFAQQMMQQMGGGMGGMGGMGGSQNQFPQGPGFGSGQNISSPQPQPGQGFQPPQGPSAGQQGYPQSNMEGYSPQQIAMMQQDHTGGGGGSGRGRGRRGRGFF